MKYTSVYEFEISRFLRQKLKTLEEYSLTISQEKLEEINFTARNWLNLFYSSTHYIKLCVLFKLRILFVIAVTIKFRFPSGCNSLV
jgi:hypothetical protein